MKYQQTQIAGASSGGSNYRPTVPSTLQRSLISFYFALSDHQIMIFFSVQMLQGGPSGVTPGDPLASTTSASGAAVAPENAPGKKKDTTPITIFL